MHLSRTMLVFQKKGPYQSSPEAAGPRKKRLNTALPGGAGKVLIKSVD